eukprot:gene45969-57311_t
MLRFVQSLMVMVVQQLQMSYPKTLKQSYNKYSNAGDSRTVLSQNGQAIELTKDHKPNDPIEKMRIEKLGGFVKKVAGCHRVMGNLAMSRALGDGYLKPFVS